MKIRSRAAAAAVAVAALVVVPTAFAGAAAQGASPARPAAAMPSKPAMAKLTRDQVEHVQNALVAKGYAVKADGIWGRKTRDAVKDFQKKSGLPVTGHPDAKTLEALGVTL